MILFGGFFGAAMKYRHKPEIHKRLIVAATVAFAFAAVARMNFAPPIFFVIWMAPMAANRIRPGPRHGSGTVARDWPGDAKPFPLI